MLPSSLLFSTHDRCPLRPLCLQLGQYHQFLLFVPSASILPVAFLPTPSDRKTGWAIFSTQSLFCCAHLRFVFSSCPPLAPPGCHALAIHLDLPRQMRERCLLIATAMRICRECLWIHPLQRWFYRCELSGWQEDIIKKNAKINSEKCLQWTLKQEKEAIFHI